MRAVDASVFAPLANAFLELIGSGGKRLRPALALLTAQVNPATLGKWPDERVIALAAAVEMLHTSTLVHDDVIDGALLRRGAPTLNALWNGSATVLAGNYMFGTAAHFAAETRHPRVIRLFADTLKIIVDGELRQLSARNDYQQKKSNYYQRIYAKTASLFVAATEGAALLAGLPETAVQHLHDYGYHFGMAFQIVDDMLDYTGNEASLGKPAGSDLRQGTLTLPFFHYLRQHPKPEALIARLTSAHERLEDGDTQPWYDAVQHIVAEAAASSAIAAAQQEALTFLEQARANLDELPDNLYKQSLLGLCDFVVQRTY
jgi:geranylgeranyl pyrophosphate synthase